MDSLPKGVTIDPEVLSGTPIFEGTRMPAALVISAAMKLMPEIRHILNARYEGGPYSIEQVRGALLLALRMLDKPNPKEATPNA